MNLIDRTCVVGGLLAALTLAFPLTADAQRTGVEVWGVTCGRCHQAQPPNRYTANQWESVLTHMMITARLTDADAEAVLGFLKSGAKAVASAEPMQARPVAMLASNGPIHALLSRREIDVAEIFGKYCAACHGTAGKGDGMAANAMNPKPPDFSEAGFQESREEEDLKQVIREGKGMMPAFARQLSAEEITALVEYIRTFSSKDGR